ncbi:tubulin-like doman-containing protein [Nakamurella sp.]|uniref:tubulin-like doman-containing protein n=1 Tax=Nakamurella sp. TaxID=1869182 RepID=UPI003B3AF21E
MYKFYVVGLGGSGGKTLQFLMDQLHSELRRRGWQGDRLPRCWQFVHVDVPAQPDGIGEGLPPTVPQQGGRYIPVTTPSDQYRQLDAGLELALSQTSDKLRPLVGWRPDASRVATPIVLGAGQFRAVGRLATLARAKGIFGGLREAAQELNAGEANQDFSELQRVLGKGYAAPQGTMVIVISSLAGGTGASMTLDVCNLLRGVQESLPGFPGSESIAYLYTPDVFSRLDESARAGVNANALGTIAELMNARAAAQKEWTQREWEVYRISQEPKAPGRGPKAVFPVGATNGISGAVFGDGRADTIYRGFARALASMVLSEAQQTQVLNYVVANFGNTEALPDNSELAWAPGGGRDALGFGAIGFASIGLGRDRYAEYVAQRLARLAVVRLLRGHVDTSVLQGQRTETEARDRYAIDNYPLLLQWAGLPPTPPVDEITPLEHWVGDVWPQPQQAQLVDMHINRVLAAAVPPGVRQNAAFYAGQLAAAVPGAYAAARQEAERAVLHSAAARWVLAIQGRIEVAVLRCLARWGLPVTRKMVEHMEGDLRQWAAWLRARAQPTSSPDQATNEVLTPLYATSGVIDPTHLLLQQARDGLTAILRDVARRTGAAIVADLVDGLAGDVVRPLMVGLGDVERALAAAEDNRAVDTAVSSVTTTVVQAWPQDDLVPGRFATATNEVLLEGIDSYPGRFTDHLYATFELTVMPTGQRPSREESIRFAVEQAITFFEIDPSGQRIAPAEHLIAFGEDGYTPTKIGRLGSWWPRMLAGTTSAQTARYEPRLTAEALLDGTREWVNRPGQTLQGFVRQGLQSYLGAAADGPQARQAREDDFANRFRTALQLAAPLVGVHPNMVGAIHDQPVRVAYQFSAAPLRGAPAAVRRISQDIEANPAIDAGPTLQRLNQALNAEEANTDLPSVEIVGTYAFPYSPLVFTSLLGPIQEQWARSISVQQRTAFWRWRRGRSLGDFVPVSPAWFQAFITGWLVGRLTGEIRTPRPGDTDQRITVWHEGRWAAFPEALLGVQQVNRDVQGWGIPAAVVESLALAIAQCNGDDRLTALTPYVTTRKLGEDLPMPGSIDHPALHAWLVGGRSRSGQPPQVIRPDDPVATRAERMALARDWLTRLQSQVVHNLRETDRDGTRIDGQFSQITKHNFGQVPREWEIGEQLVVGVDAILAELERPVYREDDDLPPPIIDVLA